MGEGELIQTFVEPAGEVQSVAFSPDGRNALSGSWDKTLALWDTATGQLLRRFKGHSREVYSVALSPDGARALSGSVDGTMNLWQVATRGTPP